MNEVAKMNAGEIVVADPFSPETYHNAGNVSALIASANARLVQRRAEFDALGDLAEAPIEAVKTMRRALEDDDKALRDFDGDVKSALLDMSGFKAYIVQTKGTGTRIDPLSVRGKFAVMLKALKAREDAEKPKEPTHTYFYAVTCTDAEHGAVQKAMSKVVAKFDVVSPQKDAEWRTAAKLFNVKEN